MTCSALRRLRLPVLAALLLGGCQTRPTTPPAPAEAAVIEEEGPAWRRAAESHDIERIEAAAEAWTTALADARGGFAREIEAEGPLLDPAAALPRPAPPPGSYLCRVIKLGGATRAFAAFKPFFCYVGVEEDFLTITKQTGSERPGGYLYDDGEGSSRMIFLGSMALGEEAAPHAYGEADHRDMVGVLERVGPFRYRLVIPWPRSQSKLDVFELIPAPVQAEEPPR